MHDFTTLASIHFHDVAVDSFDESVRPLDCCACALPALPSKTMPAHVEETEEASRNELARLGLWLGETGWQLNDGDIDRVRARMERDRIRIERLRAAMEEDRKEAGRWMVRWMARVNEKMKVLLAKRRRDRENGRCTCDLSTAAAATKEGA